MKGGSVRSAVEELRKAADLCGQLRLSWQDEGLTAGSIADVASFLQAETGCFRSLSAAGGVAAPDRVVSAGIPQSVDDAYLNRYYRLDPARRFLRRPPDKPLLGHSMRNVDWGPAPASAAERHRDWVEFLRYRREFLLPNGFFHHLGFCFRACDGRLLLFDFHRPAGAPAFGKLEQARARIVATYLHGCTAPPDRDCETSRSTAESGRLSAREAEVAEAVIGGLSNKEVAARLSISVRTVENHMRAIFSKLGVTTRTRLAVKLHGERT